MSERKIWWHKSRGELRWWLHFWNNCFHIQLAKPEFRICFGVSDGEHVLHGSLCGFYWYLDCFILSRLITKFRGGHWPPYDRSFRFYWFERGLWFSLWGDDYECSSSDPWWKKTYHLNPADLIFGKSKYSNEELETFEDVIIPMPERNYLATLTFERSTWKRPRAKAEVRNFTRIELDREAPKFPGKGENSWDQDDDCIWACSVEGHSFSKAIGDYVRRCLEYREKRAGREGFFANPVTRLD